MTTEEQLEREIESLEMRIDDLERDNHDLEDEISDLEAKIEDYKLYFASFIGSTPGVWKCTVAHCGKLFERKEFRCPHCYG